MFIDEPQVVYPERQFQTAVATLINAVLAAESRQFTLLEPFGLDIGVFFENAGLMHGRFFEVKAYNAQRMGGVGFGDSRGGGQQVTLLLSPDNCFPVFRRVMRWAYVDATASSGASRYALLTCEDAKAAAMGGVARGKQNNLRISAFRANLVSWVDFEKQVREFLFDVVPSG